MAQISRLKEAEIANGNLIDADDLGTEFDSLVSESNSQDTRISNLESGNVTISGVKTFTSDIKINGIDERTNNGGIDVDGVTCKDGYINIALTGAQIASVDTGTDVVTTSSAHGLTSAQPIKFITTGTLPGGLSTGTVYYPSVLSTTTFEVYTDSGLSSQVDITSSGSGSHEISSDPASPSDGDVWYNTADDELKVQINGSTATVTTSSVGWAKGHIAGGHIKYESATEVVIPSGFKCRDDSNTVNIDVTSDITIDISTSTGSAVVNALMNGLTESSNQWYYIWVIAKAGGADPAGILTTSSSDVTTMPTDYLYHRLLGVVRNESGNFIPFDCKGSWDCPEYIYNVGSPLATATAGITNVLDGGTATTWTAVDCSSFIPPLSTMGYFDRPAQSGNDYLGQIRPTGETHDGLSFKSSGKAWMRTNSSQSIDYKWSTGTYDITVLGFALTELN